MDLRAMRYGELATEDAGDEASGSLDRPFSDDELTMLALSAGDSDLVDPAAVPLVLEGRARALLPTWYMAPVVVGRVAGWRRPVVVAIVAALFVLEGLGLCSVFGQVVIG